MHDVEYFLTCYCILVSLKVDESRKYMLTIKNTNDNKNTTS